MPVYIESKLTDYLEIQFNLMEPIEKLNQMFWNNFAQSNLTTLLK